MIIIVSVLVGLATISAILRVYARFKLRVRIEADDYLCFTALFLLYGMLIQLILCGCALRQLRVSLANAIKKGVPLAGMAPTYKISLPKLYSLLERRVSVSHTDLQQCSNRRRYSSPTNSRTLLSSPSSRSPSSASTAASSLLRTASMSSPAPLSGSLVFGALAYSSSAPCSVGRFGGTGIRASRRLASTEMFSSL